MTDIAALVERLRDENYTASRKLMLEAANALEACQAEIERLRDAMAVYKSAMRTCDRDWAEAEIERLRKSILLFETGDTELAREHALEEAAEEAEIEAGVHAMKGDHAPMNAALRIAAAIRALKDINERNPT